MRRAWPNVKGELTGTCICGAVTYRINDGFRMGPYACHCTDCQKRTGSAFSEHMLFSADDLEITGELNEGKVTQPSGAQSRIIGCAKCMSRIYAVNDQREGFASLRCGSLDNSAQVVPIAHVSVPKYRRFSDAPSAANHQLQPTDAIAPISAVAATTVRIGHRSRRAVTTAPTISSGHTT